MFSDSLFFFISSLGILTLSLSLSSFLLSAFVIVPKTFSPFHSFSLPFSLFNQRIRWREEKEKQMFQSKVMWYGKESENLSASFFPLTDSSTWIVCIDWNKECHPWKKVRIVAGMKGWAKNGKIRTGYPRESEWVKESKREREREKRGGRDQELENEKKKGNQREKEARLIKLIALDHTSRASSSFFFSASYPLSLYLFLWYLCSHPFPLFLFSRRCVSDRQPSNGFSFIQASNWYYRPVHFGSLLLSCHSPPPSQLSLSYDLSFPLDTRNDFLSIILNQELDHSQKKYIQGVKLFLGIKFLGIKSDWEYQLLFQWRDFVEMKAKWDAIHFQLSL